MKSVHIINRVIPPAPGATGVLADDLAEYLTAQGWRVTITSCDAVGPRSIPAQLRDMAVLSRRALRAPRCDVVLSMTDPPLLVALGSIVARCRGSKHVHWCQDLYPDLLVLWRRLPFFIMTILRAVTATAYRRVDGAVAIGRCMGDRLRDSGVPAGRIRIIPNWPVQGVDPATLPASPPTRDVLYAGTLGRAHPIEGLLDAAARLQAGGSPVRFIICGGGVTRPELADRAQRLGLANIVLLPPQDDRAYRALCASAMAHLVLMRGDIAGCLVPSKAYAAFANARPLIFAGPEECEIARSLRDHGGGACVPPGDGAALAAAILRYDDAALWRVDADLSARLADQNSRARALALWHDTLNDVLTAPPSNTSMGRGNEKKR